MKISMRKSNIDEEIIYRWGNSLMKISLRKQCIDDKISAIYRCGKFDEESMRKFQLDEILGNKYLLLHYHSKDICWTIFILLNDFCFSMHILSHVYLFVSSLIICNEESWWEMTKWWNNMLFNLKYYLIYVLNILYFILF